jgi:GNAT superfamily N-acetyltransferase
MIYSDRTLSQKLERTEGRANLDFVETRKSLFPDSNATWIEVGGAYAMFDGVGSPLTQTFGLGIFEDATDAHLEEIERFYRERGSDIFHEVSPMTDPALMSLLSGRGYKPIEMTTVMYLDLGSRIADFGFENASRHSESKNPQSEIRNPKSPSARRIEESEVDLWAETAAAGWASEGEELADFIKSFGAIAARCNGGHPFLAELDDRPIAAGGLQIYEDVCILAGASTIPDARRKGAQNELLKARLKYAHELGCRFAMMCALPGSQSQKNAQKNGFNIAYTRTKWHLTL